MLSSCIVAIQNFQPGIMIDSQLLLFLTTSLVIILTPGQDLVLTISHGVSQGEKAAVATAAGVSVGLLGHTTMATLGFGALLMASESIFSTIKYIGATYLLYLGYKIFTAENPATQIKQLSRKPLLKCFSTGALSNISNPKITIFYFAYLPQFISAGQESPWKLFLLGSAFALLTFLVKAPIGYLAGLHSGWILKNSAVFNWFNRFSAVVLIGLGIRLAISDR